MEETGLIVAETGLVSNVTQILDAIEHGDAQASEQLLPLVYDELRRLAAQRLANEPPGQTLQATALVHDAFVRLVDVDRQQKWNSRGHFFGAAAEAMRRILVENARRKARMKHGGDLVRQELNEADIVAPLIKHDLLALDEALNGLAMEDREKYELVKLRFFAGLTIAQAADVLGISTSTADRHWAYARAWLYRRVATFEPNSGQ
jgi:RNA polymerase sigma factor (TIGR02999 family)